MNDRTKHREQHPSMCQEFFPKFGPISGKNNSTFPGFSACVYLCINSVVTVQQVSKSDKQCSFPSQN